jgi:NTP pyrophosphatase (non-canonical NTP hydrolase)
MNQDFASLISQAIQVRDQYNELNAKDGHTTWSVTDTMSGFVGDVGDLSKLIMAKQGLRRGPDDVNEKLAHELADCLWSIIVIANQLGVDLETEFTKTMSELSARIEQQKSESSRLS